MNENENDFHNPESGAFRSIITDDGRSNFLHGGHEGGVLTTIYGSIYFTADRYRGCGTIKSSATGPPGAAGPPQQEQRPSAGFMWVSFGDRHLADQHHPVPVRVGARLQRIKK